MSKAYNVLVEADAWVDVVADSREDARQKAKGVLVSNPYGWDRVDATVTSEEEVEN